MLNIELTALRAELNREIEETTQELESFRASLAAGLPDGFRYSAHQPKYVELLERLARLRGELAVIEAEGGAL